ncbi:Probable asparagine--tRNA ligase, mitochondrial [Geodia barretti]|uniref:Probable asparagine--tRNA ligase, mitochondrial n=1 Tax=Geodia barretti TaxID=519541 RepID=A0AA35XAM4_GEOBA|nr:Probable asparagine--tRNA ligase, mitochondrial [Geodia barretti]
MLFRQNVVVRLWPRVATVSAAVRTLTSRITVRDAVAATSTREDVSVLGWVKNMRKQKELVFIDLNDGSTAARLQVVAPSNLLRGVHLNVGCSVVAKGKIVPVSLASQDVELAASQVQLLGTCDPKKYPFKRGKIHGVEYLRQFPHLRPQTGVFSRVLRLRSAATMAVHRFFQDRGFINFHTPIISSSDCEGAGELFEIRPSQAAEDEKRFFSTDAFLTVSGQLHAEAVTSGMSAVYTFGPTFRAEKSHTKRHLSEFYMVEAETVLHGSGLSELLCLVEDLYKHTLEVLLKDNYDDINYFHETICSDEAKLDFDTEFHRETICQDDLF